MPINLEKHEITIILKALNELPYKDVAALIRKIVNQMAEHEENKALHSGVIK